ncbi:MAG: hypothetical protein ABIQ09_18915 [Jatrophihabitantaceae bacterium]
MAEKDPYQLLGVPRDASDERIRAAYELEINRATRDGAIRYAAELSAAYDTISSPQRRALYERHGFTAISERSSGVGAPHGAWRATQQQKPAGRGKRRLRTLVLLIVVLGLVMALFLATRDSDGVGATAPPNNGPTVVHSVAVW